MLSGVLVGVYCSVTNCLAPDSFKNGDGRLNGGRRMNLQCWFEFSNPTDGLVTLLKWVCKCSNTKFSKFILVKKDNRWCSFSLGQQSSARVSTTEIYFLCIPVPSMHVCTNCSICLSTCFLADCFSV